MAADSTTTVLRWKEDVERLAKIPRLATRKSVAFAEEITGFCWCDDNVGWVLYTPEHTDHTYHTGH